MADSIKIVFEAVDQAATATTKQVAGGLDKVGESAKNANQGASVLTQGVKGLIGGMTAANLITDVLRASLQFLKQQFTESIKAAQESEDAMASMQGTLIATGRAGEMTAQQMEALAQSLSKGTRFDDEAIMNVVTALLRFDSVSRENLPQITQAVLDFSAAMQVDAATAAQQLGGALETGLLPKALRLDTATKENFRSMVQLGDEAGALALLMDVLGGKTGDHRNNVIDIRLLSDRRNAFLFRRVPSKRLGIDRPKRYRYAP